MILHKVAEYISKNKGKSVLAIICLVAIIVTVIVVTNTEQSNKREETYSIAMEYLRDGNPEKAKELFAYLVYRRGSSCTTRELAAVLFEDTEYSAKQMLYLQKIVSSMMQTLRAYNAANVVHKTYNAIARLYEIYL